MPFSRVRNAVETPLRVDDGLGELAFGERFGSETEEEFVGEFAVSVEIFGGQDYDAGGQAVAQSVQAGDLFTSLTFRSRALLSVAAVGFYLDDVEC
jgi:hypothetical protein